MTTPPIDWRTLPAGRELDALVAERVFGATHIKRHRYWGRSMRRVWQNGATSVVQVPRYSMRIDAAWEVVDAMVSRGWRVSVMNRAARRWGCCVIVGCAPDDRQHFEYDGDLDAHEGPASAICRAALAAVEAPHA